MINGLGDIVAACGIVKSKKPEQVKCRRAAAHQMAVNVGIVACKNGPSTILAHLKY